MDTASIILIALVLLLPWGLIFIFIASSNKKTVNNFKKLEEKYGLKADFSKKVGMKKHPNAQGVYRNRNVKIDSIITDAVDTKKAAPHTALMVECSNPGNFSFFVVKRKRQNNASYLSGSTMLNDSEFDDKFIIQTNNPEKLRSVFDFNTKFKLDQVHTLGFEGMIKLDANRLIYLDRGLMNDDVALMRIELIMHELCDIADVMKYN